MSAPSNDQQSARKQNLRHSSQRKTDGQRLRKKAITTSRNQNALSGNGATSNRSRPANSQSTGHGSGHNNGYNNEHKNDHKNDHKNGKSNSQSHGGSRQRSRAGTPRSGEQKSRKSYPISEAQASQNSTKQLQDMDVDYKNIPEVSEHFLASISDKNLQKNANPIQRFTVDDIIAAGPLFPDPSSLGFQRPDKVAPPRPVPRYMLHQPRLLTLPFFNQTDWDKNNQEKMLRMESANKGSDFQSIYEEFQKMRDIERKKMEELGLVDAENTAKDLNDAILFQGTCLDMCPTFERVRRSLENNVKHLEQDPVTQKISRDRAVKAFSRPAAGQPPPIPSDVRPPGVLQKTLDYLVETIVPQLPESHSFLWDRTRSIRQDFVYQNYYGPEAIDCNERIVRVHLLSLHIMAGSDMEYSQQQELEQLNKALQTLMEIYSDVRNHGGRSPNEAEFWGYHLISHFRDPALEREVYSLPDHVLKSNEVQLAMRFRLIMSQNNVVERGYTNKIGALNLFVEFFRLVYSEETPLLLAFLLESHFNEIRFYALKSMSRAYHTKSKAFSAESLRQMLGFDTLSKLTDFVNYYEIDTLEAHGELLVDICNKEKLESKYKLSSIHDKPKRSPEYSPQLSKRLKRYTYQSLINSGASNADLKMTPITNEGLGKMTSSQSTMKSVVEIAPEPQKASSFSSASPQVKLEKNVPFGHAPPSSSFGKTPSSATTKPLGAGPFGNSQATSSGLTGQASTGRAFGAPCNTPSFDFTAGTKSQSQSKPAIAIKNSSVSKTEILPPISKPDPPSITSNSFSFGRNSNQKSSGIDVAKDAIFGANILKKQEEKKPELKNDASKNKNVLSFTRSTPAIASPVTVAPKTLAAKTFAPTTVAAKTLTSNTQFLPTNPKPANTVETLSKQKCFKDSPHYTKALSLLSAEFIKQAVSNEVRKLSAQVADYSNRVYERYRLIDTLADELYSAFIHEQVHHFTLETLAQDHYSKTLKRKAISRIQRVSKRALAKETERALRQKEVAQMTFKTPSLKKRSHGSISENTFLSAKRRSITPKPNASIDDIHHRQEQIQELWRPLDLNKFAGICEKGTRLKPENGPVALSCILIAENWNFPYSKWLNTKFSLSRSADKTFYSHQAECGSLRINFRSLLKTELVNEQSFLSVPFLVFECGLIDQTQLAAYPTLEKKLERDQTILEKLVKICDRFSYYKVHILLVVWDITNCGTSFEEKRRLLNADKITESQNCVRKITMCDMTAVSINFAQVLQQQVFAMGETFTGELSKRGLRKRAARNAAAVSKILENDLIDSASVAESLKAKEDAVLKRAKNLYKRRYLSAHVTANRSADLTNTTLLRTHHASLANHTLINYNHSVLGNNTFLHARDTSFMRSFNASVLEESTPMGSPGPKSRIHNLANIPHSVGVQEAFAETLSKRQALPKNVKELREITASIKEKYKAKFQPGEV